MSEDSSPPSESPRLLSVRRAAAYLGVPRKRLYYWLKNRRIPYLRVGRLVYFDRIELETWMTKCRVPAIP